MKEPLRLNSRINEQIKIVRESINNGLVDRKEERVTRSAVIRYMLGLGYETHMKMIEFENKNIKQDSLKEDKFAGLTKENIG